MPARILVDGKSRGGRALFRRCSRSGFQSQCRFQGVGHFVDYPYCKDDELGEIGSQLAEGSINAGTVKPWRNSAFVLLVLAKARPCHENSFVSFALRSGLSALIPSEKPDDDFGPKSLQTRKKTRVCRSWHTRGKHKLWWLWANQMRQRLCLRMHSAKRDHNRSEVMRRSC